jgi:hypothetical protein
MRFTTRRTLAAVAVIGAVAAGGAAYTAGSGFGSVPTSSYAGTTIAGAATSALTFDYSNDGSHILAANFTLTPANFTDNYADGATYEIQAGFGIDSSPDGNPGETGLQASTDTANDPTNPCVATAVPATGPVTNLNPNTTTVTCSFASPGIVVSDTNDTAPVDNDAASGLSDSTTNPVPSGSTGHNPANTLTGADQFNVLVTTIAPTS